MIILIIEVYFFVFQIRQSFPSDYYSLVVENLRVLLLVALIIVVFSHVVGGARWRRCVVQLVHMCVFLGASSFIYFIMPHQSYSGFLNGVQGGVHSLNESWFIYLLMSVLVSMQIALSDLEYFEQVVQRVTYGFYALAAVFLPSVIGSYNLIQAYLTIECNPEYVAEREWCNMIFSMVVGSMVLYAFSPSFRKLCVKLGLGACEQAVPAQSKEIQASASGSVGALPKRLMGAAVSGLVAGVCFSVVSRLFGRR